MYIRTCMIDRSMYIQVNVQEALCKKRLVLEINIKFAIVTWQHGTVNIIMLLLVLPLL